MNGFIRRLGAIALLGLASLQMAGCSWHTDSVPESAQSSSIRLRAAEVAREQIGTPYRYGGRTPRGFDCSGLVHYAYQSAGKSVPRTSKDQYRAARPIALRDARPGDLLFFKGWRSISHVGIYVGGNRFVHAPSKGKRVTITRLDDDYYKKKLVSVGRL